MVAFIVWSFIYAVYNAIQGVGFKAVVLSAIAINNHLWFLPMMIGLYLILPFLSAITDNKVKMQYFFALSLIYSVIVPNCLKSLSFWNYNAHLIDALNSFNTSFCFYFTRGFVFYFVLGYYLFLYNQSKKVRVIIYLLGIFGFVSSYALSEAASFFQHYPTDLYFENSRWNVLLESVAVFVFFKAKILSIQLNDCMKAAIIKISERTFGIYLVHMLVIRLLDTYLHLSAISFQPALSIPVVSLLVAVISYLIVAQIEKIPVINCLMI